MGNSSSKQSALMHVLYNLSPAICAAIVIATAIWLKTYLDIGDVDLTDLKINPIPDSGVLRSKQLAAQIAWTTSLFAYFLAFIVIMHTSISIMLHSLHKKEPLKNVIIFCFVIILSIIACFTFKFERVSIGLVIDMMNEYLDYNINLLILADRCGTIAIVFVIAAASLILSSKRELKESQTFHKSEQGKDLMRLLYVASLFLVAGIFEIKMCMDYLIIHILPDDNYDRMKLLINNLDKQNFEQLSLSYKFLKEVADSTRTMSGAVYTALLAAMYLPAGLIIDARLKQLGKDSVEGGTDSPMPPAVTRILNLVAGLAPFVMGTSLDILGKIKL